MRTRVERLRDFTAFDDERFRSHRTRDNSVTSVSGVDRTLSGNVNLIAEVFLDRDVVVMTVDHERSADTLVRIAARGEARVRMSERHP